MREKFAKSLFKQEIFSHVANNNKEIVKELRFMSFIVIFYWFLIFIRYHVLQVVLLHLKIFLKFKKIKYYF